VYINKHWFVINATVLQVIYFFTLTIDIILAKSFEYLPDITKSYPKNISAVKKGEAKKVQVTERPKDMISL